MRHRARTSPKLFRAAAMMLGGLVLAASVSAAPQAELWPRWTEHDPDSTRTVSHDAWADFLDAYLVTETSSGVNLVRYDAVTASDAERLTSYVDMLEEVPVSELSRPEQFAYWVNLYNAHTIEVILEHYPVESIRDIGGLFANGPWDQKKLRIEGTRVSLNDIEHRILRPIWEDPRIHYAVNCASMGCPNLQPTPFTPENTERLLEQGARAYVRHPRGARFNGSTLVLSSVYDWFQADFGGSLSGVLTHIRQYAEPSFRRRLEGFDGSTVRYEYDWSLNEPE